MFAGFFVFPKSNVKLIDHPPTQPSTHPPSHPVTQAPDPARPFPKQLKSNLFLNFTLFKKVYFLLYEILFRPCS